MEKIQLPATKSNLLRMREELSLARDGLELLDEKKEILINQITFLGAKAEDVRTRVNRALERAYISLKKALLENGTAAVESAGLGVKAGERLVLRERSLMGVVLPLVGIELPALRPSYGLYGTGQSMDATSRAIHEAMEVIAELAEVEVGLQRLMAELKRTLKRINALEYIYVPSYEATVKALEETLEEREREALFQLKLMRQRAVEAERSVSE